MSVHFKSIARKDPRDATAIPKHYALVVSSGVTDIDQLSQLVSDGSTVTRADVYAVIVRLVTTIQNELSQGRTVRLGKLGSFSLGVNSEGVDTPEEVTPSLIKRTKIRYRPSIELSNMLKTLRFKKKSE
ncbi:putative histone-like DNA-binding protein [Aquimarina sp. EL_43]|uniref:HU family DNA-binding protein n=1 Tax=unclassified Aquimarina TaxID=2627091 RepID=UPI0018CB6FC9|nr:MULTISPECIES: HU family DNA-binding protein [unclassified Aquimarina]MBG6132519.1 putative histone-like DNA-binding protein [Aquimarina sp. EL_35]MBG6152650.1 putative histone-like DNA-binding protein [Aquimarina sp. EL_32]MBG6170657.1 putative histone-like DNA-binding protein [Aquimarina sp. EL_43]